jgi:GAF domain
MLEKDAARDMLVLGPFKGTMTPHTRIALNQGICGAAGSTGKTIVIDDVSADPRYLACSLETKSEIVVPVFVHNRVAGELDIDSHFLAALAPMIACSANTPPRLSANSSSPTTDTLLKNSISLCGRLLALVAQICRVRSLVFLLGFQGCQRSGTLPISTTSKKKAAASPSNYTFGISHILPLRVADSAPQIPR